MLPFHDQRFVRRDAGARFGDYPVADAHAASEDQALRPAPALGEAPLDEQDV
jgi:hypothetical protein